MTETKQVKYLIIGNSAGGIGAAEAIREVDHTGAITMVSDEPYPAYSRPLISEYLSEGRPLDRMRFRPADFYENHNIRIKLGSKVERLDAEAHTIRLDDSGTITWDRLLLATGGSPITPRVNGINLRGVFTFTTLDDAKAIDKFLKQFRNKRVKAVVIGGGLIGVSVTEALVKRGLVVTLVEMKERILSTILDEDASVMIEETLEQFGVKVITGHTVAGVNGDTTEDDRVDSVTLDNGKRIRCELVIVAIGVSPRTGLAVDAGLKVNRGAVVDRRMATSCPDIFACGDIAEAYDFVLDENRITPVWPNAYLGGRIAGFNMAGVPSEYPGGTSMNSLKYFGLAVVSAGIVIPPDDGYEILCERHDQVYRKVILKEGFLMGMVFVGDIEKSGIVFNLMKDRVNVDGFKSALVNDDFGLISLPEAIWQPRLKMPPALATSPATPMKKPEAVIMGE